MSKNEGEHIDAKISVSDVDAIRLLIQGLPKVDQRIISMQLEKNGTVRVWTGIIWGPRAGHGQFVALEREEENWRVVSAGGWIA